MRCGVILPSFREDPEEALAVARRADEVGVDGVFCYDHLWPMGQPDRPALAPFPLLGLVAVSTERVRVGTLVARIRLVPDPVLVDEFVALATLSGGRVIAGLGTGDHLSAAENRAYGLPFPPAATRRAAVRDCARALADRGLAVWIGGGARPTRAIAEEEGVAVNLWGAAAAAVASQSARSEVTWAGPVPSAPADPAPTDPAPTDPAPTDPAPADPAPTGDRWDQAGAVRRETERLAAAGATWVVYPWPAPLEAMVEAARALGPAGGDHREG